MSLKNQLQTPFRNLFYVFYLTSLAVLGNELSLTSAQSLKNTSETPSGSESTSHEKTLMYLENVRYPEHDLNGTYFEAKFSRFSSLRHKLYNGDANEQVLNQLINFIFEASTQRNFYFFHDFGPTDISSSLANCYNSWAEVTLFRCNEAINHLQRLIKSFNKLESIRNIVVICSSEYTRLLFREIRTKILESAVTHWFVILQENILNDIMEYIREGTQVTFAVKQLPGKYDLMSSYVDINNKMALHKLGWWSWNVVEGTKKSLSRPIYISNLEVYKDFGGRELTATVIDNWPFWVLEYPKKGGVIAVSGMDYHVLTTIGQKLNFTFRVELTPDGLWGGVLKDGSVTGMVGVVHRHEAHLAINEFTITDQREKAVDFTKPYFSESITLVTPAPTKVLRSYAVFMSFTYKVWIVILIMLIIIGPMVKAMVWLREKLLREEPPRWNSLPEISFNMFRCILIQDIRIHSSIQAYRFIFIGWFFYSLLMISLYADVMIAHLAVPSFEKPIDSLYDLLGALKHRGFYTVLGCGSNNEFIYSSTDMKIYQDIWELFDRDEGCIKTWDEGMAKVLSGKYAFSNNRMGAEVRAYKLGRDKFHFAEHEFYAHGYSIACPNGSPYRNVFEEVLVYLMSCGLVHKYVKDEMERAVEFVGDANKGLEPIGIKHLQAAFYLVLVGNVLAFTVLMIEMMKKPNAVNDLS